jgi:sulfoxide reductase catalytic subunit YedY
MYKRREFIKMGAGALAGLSIFFGPFFSSVQWVFAKAQRTILPKGTKRESLVSKDPKNLDTRNLELTDLKDFRTMGITDHEVNLDEWRLEVSGSVKNQIKLTYADVLSLPSHERKVLLICPGVFANHGRWKGIDMRSLLEKAGFEEDVKRITFSGPKGSYEKTETFPFEDVLSGRVFLAYEVNGKPLPRKHGFPLRIVAEDYYGDDWVKYVYKMHFDKG